MKFDSLGWLDVAEEIDYLQNSMDRQGYGIKYLVLHGTAGGTSARAIGQFFQGTQGGPNPVSSHIIIDQQGIIVQGVPLSLAAFGNGVIGAGHASYIREDINPNLYTASIEFVKASTDNSDALTTIQTQKGFDLIRCICDTYNIPKRAADGLGGICKHADIDPVNRARCPGTFEFDALWAYLKGGTTPVAPIQPTASQLKSANDSWDSVLKSTVAGPAPKGTGIYQAWLQALVVSGKFYGPPITREYDSVDWNGGHIVCQEFAHARCEWSGSANWYGTNGKI